MPEMLLPHELENFYTQKMDPQTVQAISRACAGHLKGIGAVMQGAVLADLVSQWLAAHVVVDGNLNIDEANTKTVREKSLEIWLDSMMKMVKIDEQKTIDRIAAMRARGEKPPAL